MCIRDRVTDIQRNLAPEKFISAGRQAGEGLSAGILIGQPAAMISASNLASEVFKKASDIPSLYSEGVHMADGLARGIRAGKSGVVRAVEEMCTDAVLRARAKLEIRSPSKVFEKIGVYTAEGFGVGYQKEMLNVGRTIEESMNFDNYARRAALFGEKGVERNTEMLDVYKRQLFGCATYREGQKRGAEYGKAGLFGVWN